MANRKHGEAYVLETYENALTNVKTQPQIKASMAEVVYDDAVIAEGDQLLQQTKDAVDLNQLEDDESRASYQTFSNLENKLDDLYGVHRKKAKVIFKNDPLNQDKLGVSGTMPRSYVRWLQTVENFYSTATADADIQSRLGRLAITPEQIAEGNQLVAEIKTARADYLREKGESQDATQQKDAAFANLDDWMSDFYVVARIALEDQPQLLEALGKKV